MNIGIKKYRVEEMYHKIKDTFFEVISILKSVSFVVIKDLLII